MAMGIRLSGDGEMNTVIREYWKASCKGATVSVSSTALQALCGEPDILDQVLQ